jgi:MFS transporter, DHA1 family, inner membrane transport protein
MNPKELKILLLLAALNFTHILDFMVMMPLGNLIMPYFNVGTKAFSILVSAYAFSAGFSSFFSAFFVNNYDRKKVLLFAYIGFIIGTLGCALAPTFTILLVARIVAGLFGGMLGAQVISIVSDTIDFERRGQAMGMVMSAFSLASIAGVPLGLILANQYSWHMPFYLVAVLALISFVLLYFNLPSLTGHIAKAKLIDNRSIINSVIQDKTQRGALFFSGLMMMGHFMIIPFINPFLEFNNGYSKSFAPMVYLVGGIASLIAANILGKMADKYGKWKVFKYCVIASFPLIFFVTNIPIKNSILVIFIFALWFAASTGRGVTSQALVSNVVKPELRGSFQSFNSFMQQLGTGLASILGGFIVSSGADFKLTNYPILGILSVIVLGLTIIIGKPIFISNTSSNNG